MPAQPRPIWTGQVRLALVTFPIRLYSAAQSTARVVFHQIHEPSGQRIRYEKVAPGVGPVPKEEIARGVEVEKGRYILLSDAEIDGVKLEAKRTFDLVQFVDAHAIDPMYFDTPYYAAPDGKLAQDSFRVVRDALRAAGKYGVGQIAMRGKAYLAAVKPCGRGLLVETLRFENDIRRSAPYFETIDDVPADAELVALARELIERKAGAFEPEAFHDDYADALERLISTKAATRRATIIEDDERAPSERGAEIVSLVDALKRSLGEGAKARAKPAAKPAGARATPKPAPKPRRKKA